MNPAWTAGAKGNIIAPQNVGIAGQSVGAYVDFRGVMRGRVVAQATPAGVAGSGVVGTQVYLYLASFATAAIDSTPLLSFLMPPTAGATYQASYDLDSGYYYVLMVNNDSTYTSSVNVTGETLSWPS